MKKSVQIHINSSQQYGDYADQINSSSRGEYSCCKKVHTFKYTEKLEGDLVVHNKLVLREEDAELIRSGAVTSHMVFAKGKTTEMTYQTDFGLIEFMIATQRYNVVIEEQHVHVLIQYDLKQNSEKVSTNFLQMDMTIAE